MEQNQRDEDSNDQKEYQKPDPEDLVLMAVELVSHVSLDPLYTRYPP